MKNQSFLFLAIVPISSVFSQDCNICGDGNSIQYPQGVVQFEYEGQHLKNSCSDWQNIVKNPNTISDAFCRNEMLQYTKEPCLCTTPGGELLSDLDTSAPTPSSVFVGNPTPTKVPNQVGGATNNTEVLKCQQESGSPKGCSDEVKDTSAAKALTFRTVWTIASFSYIAFFV
jgi:hypothetical protein